MAVHAVCETTNLRAVHYAERIWDAVSEKDIDNGTIGYLDGVSVKGGVIYYVGPTPAKPGRAIGSAGPTSSYRMDAYSEPLMQQGLKVMIGKGPRSEEYRQMLVKYGAIYVSAIGGAAASISESVKKCDLVCYEDLGAEAVYRLEVEGFFGIVTYDSKGNDLFAQEIKKYKKI